MLFLASKRLSIYEIFNFYIFCSLVCHEVTHSSPCMKKSMATKYHFDDDMGIYWNTLVSIINKEVLSFFFNFFLSFHLF